MTSIDCIVSDRHLSKAVFRCVATTILLAGSVASPDAAESPDDLDIRQENPSFLVSLDVDRPDRRYTDGEPITIRVKSERDAHLHVLYRQADGKVFQIFPNEAQRNGAIRVGEEISIPAVADTFRWSVGPPYGKETLKVIATERPLEPLSAPDLFEGRFNPVSSVKLEATKAILAKGIQVEADIGAWAEAEVEITTGQRPQPPVGKRVGLFVGVSDYQFDAFHVEGGGSPMKLPCSSTDARFMNDTFIQRCGVTESLVLVNEEATRENVRKAVCDWLPTHSDPGDVIFIFVSSHGTQFLDRNGDEPDRLDEGLTMHDSVTVSAFLACMKRQQGGTLDPATAASIAPLAEKIIAEGRAGRIEIDNPQHLGAVLSEQTEISDDQFAHWLQRLSGRRVAVFLCTCHSGGFAAAEKGLAGSANSNSDGEVGFEDTFGYLDREMGRLKNLGQAEVTLVAACLTHELTAAVRFSDEFISGSQTKVADAGGRLPLGPTTYELAKAVEVPGIMLHQAFDRYRRGLADYFRQYNEILRSQGKPAVQPHHPVMYDYSRKPLILSIDLAR